MPLTNAELLDRLLASWENEVVEFKKAAHQSSADKTGEYVSALNNEANLRGLASGWLVFGISNARQVVGTTHLIKVQQRQALKHHIHQSIDQGLTVREVYEVMHSGKRVVTLEAPKAPSGIPISWKGDYRARAGDSIAGRKAHRRITPRIAAATKAMADYIRTRPQADAHYAALLPDFLHAQGHADRGDVEALLRPTLSEALTEQQKATKITNLLMKLRHHSVIVNRGTRTKPRWELSYAGGGSTPSQPVGKKG